MKFSGTIYFIGDSFADRFAMPSLAVRQKILHPHGHTNPGNSSTLYLFGRDKGEGILKHPEFAAIEEGDALLFALGWIDVNWLIWKQVHEKMRDVDEVVDLLAKNYLDAIAALTDKKVIKIVFNQTPPAIDSVSRGTFEERVLYARKINAALAKGCPERNLEYLDVYDHYCNEQGVLRRELSDGSHHINPQYQGHLLEKLDAILSRYQ